MKRKLILIAVTTVAVVGTVVYIDTMQRLHIRELATVHAEYEDLSKRADDLENALAEAQIKQDKLNDLVIQTAKMGLQLQKTTYGLANLTVDLANLSTLNREEIRKIQKGTETKP